MNIRILISIVSVFTFSSLAFAGASKTVTFNKLVRGLFGVTDLKKAAPTVFLKGSDAEGACVVSGIYSGKSGKYSEVYLSINRAIGEFDYMEGLQIQYNSGLKMLKSDHGYTFEVQDKTCGSQGTMEAKFSSEKGYALKKMTSVRVVNKENGCNTAKEFTTHETACSDLRLVIALTPAMSEKINDMAKNYLDAEVAQYIDRAHSYGCMMNAAGPDELICTWELSDEMGGDDSATLQMVSVEVKDGKLGKIVKDWTESKWDH